VYRRQALALNPQVQNGDLVVEIDGRACEYEICDILDQVVYRRPEWIRMRFRKINDQVV